MAEARVGDLVQIIVGQPGPDVSYAVVTADHGETVDLYDLEFKMAVTRWKKSDAYVCTARSRTPRLEALAAAFRVKHGLSDPTASTPQP